jgi:hypothetical protein
MSEMQRIISRAYAPGASGLQNAVSQDDFTKSNETTIEEILAETPRGRLFQAHQEITQKAYEIMRAKNADYACAEDPFRNFRTFGLLGVLVRMSDKLARLRSFLENQTLAVKDEGVEDTLIDLVNYAVIFSAMRRSDLK